MTLQDLSPFTKRGYMKRGVLRFIQAFALGALFTSAIIGMTGGCS
jgi:hypothetical protein